jgi:hypothetical protein
LAVVGIVSRVGDRTVIINYENDMLS